MTGDPSEVRTATATAPITGEKAASSRTPPTRSAAGFTRRAYTHSWLPLSLDTCPHSPTCYEHDYPDSRRQCPSINLAAGSDRGLASGPGSHRRLGHGGDRGHIGPRRGGRLIGRIP